MMNKFLLFFSGFLVLLFTASPSLAQNDIMEGWSVFGSKSGIFKVKLPDDRTIETHALRLSPNQTAYSEEVISAIDQRPFKNAIKTYLVKFDQTIGLGLNDQEVRKLLDSELETYVDHYKTLGGAVKNQEIVEQSGAHGAEFYISYEHPDVGPQGIRVRVLFTDVTKLEQIIAGPDHIMHSLKSNDFFDTLKIQYGIPARDGSFSEEWVPYTSPLGFFTTLLPPTGTSFAPKSPLLRHGDTSDMMAFIFYDPVRKQKLLYNVYGYRFDRTLTYTDVENLLNAKHVARYRRATKASHYRRAKNEKGYPVLEAGFPVAPPPTAPYLTSGRLRAVFIKNYLVVQEVIASSALFPAPLVANTMALMTFHPEIAHERFLQKAAGLESGAPQPPTFGPPEESETGGETEDSPPASDNNAPDSNAPDNNASENSAPGDSARTH